MVTVLMMSATMANIKVFRNKVYDVIISAHDVTGEVLSRDSNSIVDVIM